MDKKILSFFLIVAVFAAAAIAVTLTADMTEKVVVPVAYKTSVCNAANPSNCKELIVGVADVYAKEWTPEEPDATLIVFEMDDKIYRTTGMSFSALASSDTELTINGMEGNSYTRVNADGTEEDVNGQYSITFSVGAPPLGIDFSNVNGLNALVFTLDGVDYSLSEVLDTSSFTWYPGTGVVE